MKNLETLRLTDLETDLETWQSDCKRGHTVLKFLIVQELCESRGGRPGLSVLTSLLVSVDVRIY